MAKFLSKAKDAMGMGDKYEKMYKDELVNHEKTIEELDAVKRDLANCKEALEQASLDLANERAVCKDLQNELDSIKMVEEEELKKEQKELEMEEEEKSIALVQCGIAYEGMKGFTTQESKLIEAFCRQSSRQLQVMKQVYMTNYGKDLVTHVRKSTGGNFRSFLLGLLQGEDYEVNLLREAMKGLSTDDNVLMEILCIASPAKILKLKEQYKAAFDRDLQADVEKNTSGDLKKLLIVLLQGERADGEADPKLIESDVKMLHAAGEGKTFGVDVQPWIQIFGNRSYPHLCALNDEYRKHQKKTEPLRYAVEHCFSGKMAKALLAILDCAIDSALYFGDVLHAFMEGVGCDEAGVARVILMRREVDIAAIIERYNSVHKQPLLERLQDELSGDLKKAVAHMLSAQDFPL